MNTRHPKDPQDAAANLAKRARLDALLFHGARPAAPASALVEPKLPPYVGE